MASPLPVEPMEGTNELLDNSLDGVGARTPCDQVVLAKDPLVHSPLESPKLLHPPIMDTILPNQVDMPMEQPSNQDPTDMFATYGRDTDNLNFDVNVRASLLGDAEPVFPDVKPVLDIASAGNTVLQAPEVAVDHSPIMGKCEFCGHFGVKEHFFSKSKRFCKVECAKKYSASNIKKRKNDRGITTTKRKSVKKTPPSKKSKPDEVFITTTQAANVTISNDWQKKCFKWDEYLKSCSGAAAPPSCFQHAHVMSCLKDIHIGMKVEVINTGIPSYNNTENTTFWVATVIKFKHFKTLLRYEGYDDDDHADFWFDLRCPDIHPVGWCARINKPLIPPPEIKSRIKDWQGYLFKRLSGAKTFSADFLKKVQEIPHNRFQVGMKVEVADRKNLYSVMCVATVVDVVGDRLRLRYDGLDPSVAEDFWCHYLSTDIHPVGWSSLVGHQLRPPIGWKNSIAEWNKLIEKILAQDRDAPQEIFSEDATGTAQGPYAFEVGMKFEGVNPYIPNQICVLTVIKELKYNYFIAGIDSQAAYFCFHANSRNIFPPGWCEAYGISLTPPKDYPMESFDWDSYCKNTCGKRAPSYLFQPHRSVNLFKPGMKLEAADLREPALVCPATVVEVRGPLLKIHFDGWDVTYDQFVDMECLDLFPVGYNEITGHPIQPPGPKPDPYCQPGYQFEESAVHVIQPSIAQKPAVVKVPKSVKEDHVAKPKQAKLPSHPEGMFFVNRRCRCGPLLNAVKFLKLPEIVKGALGGSDKHNIVRKCLQLLVSSGENPKQVLELFSREFYQSKNHVDLDLGSTVCIEIKMKNDKRIMRRIKIASKAANVNSYIARVCQLLDCCTNVFSSAKFPTEQCESCFVRQAEEQHIDVVETNVAAEESTGLQCSNLLEATGM